METKGLWKLFVVENGACISGNIDVSRHLPMRISIRHIGLIIGILSVLTSFLFFGRKQEVYHILSISGALAALICLIWIIVAKGSLKSKLLWVGVLSVGIGIDIIAEPFLIDTSYRIYLARHQEVLSDVNKILSSSQSDIWVISDSVRVSNDEGISKENRQRLLKAQKELGVYMITKNNTTIYYGLWGFLDVRLGITYLTTKTKHTEQYRHLTGNWYH